MHTLHLIRRYWTLSLVVLLFGGAVLWAITNPPAHAQSALSCEDPFADVANLRFSAGFWPRTDFCQHSVSYAEIRTGGPPPDGIPPIDAPRFETVTDARDWLSGRSPVIALRVGDEARAYPLAILMWHEIVNDEIDGTPVAVTYCPLCNSAIVFDRRVAGEVLSFGTTGNLRNSDLIMWDRQTHSWWQQFTGEAIVGVQTGAQLDVLPSQVVGFADFMAQFPDGEVLALDTGFGRSYGITPYAYYDTEGEPLMDGIDLLLELEDRLPPTSRVLAGMIGGEAIAYPFGLLSQQGAINDTVGGVPVVALWQVGVASALDTPRIDQGREIGTAALYRRTIDGRDLTFQSSPSGTITDVETGSTWNAFGIAETGPLAGTALQQLPAAGHFWFAWLAFQPDTALYSIGG